MKFIILAFVLSLAVCVYAADERCRRGDDCEEGECCVTTSILTAVRGKCRKLSAEGDSCSEEDDKIDLLGGKFLYHCPCASGLSCEATDETHIPFIGRITIGERCVSDGATTVDTLTTQKEITEVAEE